MARQQISIPLDIEDVDVLKGKVQGNSLHIQVESSLNTRHASSADGGSRRFIATVNG